MQLPGSVKRLIDSLAPRQRQWAMLIGIVVFAVGVLWIVFAASENPIPQKTHANRVGGANSRVTNIGVMPGGAQVNPQDQWMGTAGRKLAEYEQQKQEQDKVNKSQQAFQESTMRRFAELEQQLQSQAAAAQAQSSGKAPVGPATIAPPPASTLPPPPPRLVGQTATGVPGVPPGAPGRAGPAERGVPAVVRVTLSDPSKVAQGPSAAAPSAGGASKDGDSKAGTLDTYLPVSFTRGVLLGGLDAPTGGQSQSNPHPVLIRLEDNAVLPNRFRSEVRECFVIAAGYGDIASERAYLRTENLSCVRKDGTTLEVKIQGSVYGEDGKVGMRGRLVTKQGQMLANALLSGLISGIGYGLATQNTTFSTSAFGSVATTSGSDAFKAGIGAGMGRALDRLANYYIKLAEQTFPVIEVDAGREVDVVITKGVRIDAGDSARASGTSNPGSSGGSEARSWMARAAGGGSQKVVGDEDY